MYNEWEWIIDILLFVLYDSFPLFSHGSRRADGGGGVEFMGPGN
jgi:hypothetical protein